MGTAEFDAVTLQEENTYFCGVNYHEERYMMRESAEEVDPEQLVGMLKRLDERVRILQEDKVELINVPVPEFSDNDPADIVHDFNRVRTCQINNIITVNSNISVLVQPNGHRIN